jgi:hypothetical protein
MTKTPPGKVGNTQSTMFGADRRYGFGFSVQDLHGAPLLSISYDTKEDAREAEALIRKALEMAVDITKP